MGHRIARCLLVPLLRLLLPATGRRGQPYTAVREENHPVTPYLHSRTARRPWERPLRIAVDGVDIRPRVIRVHGVEVTA